MCTNFHSDDFAFKSFNSVQTNEMPIKSSLESKCSPQAPLRTRSKTFNDNNKVFVGGLNRQTEEKVFQEYFAKYGNLEDSVLIKDLESGKSRGFGFVQYTDAASVDKLMQERPHTLEQNTLDLKRSIPRTEMSIEESKAKITKLYVAGLGEGIDENDLRSHFSQFGNVLNIDIPKSKETNKTRGYAFVNFDDYDAVDKIFLAKSNLIKGIKLKVRKAFPKDQLQNNQQRTPNTGNGPYPNANSFNNMQSLMQNNFQPWMVQGHAINNNNPRFSYDNYQYPGNGFVVPEHSFDHVMPNFMFQKQQNYQGPMRNKKWNKIKQGPYQRTSSY